MNGSMKEQRFYYTERKARASRDESSKFTAYSMFTMAGGMALCLGIVLYAIVTAI